MKAYLEKVVGIALGKTDIQIYHFSFIRLVALMYQGFCARLFIIGAAE